MLVGLALQYEGQTRLSGADALPSAPCTADHYEYLASSLAPDRALVVHPLSSSFRGPWSSLTFEALHYGRPKRRQAGGRHQCCAPQRHQRCSPFFSGQLKSEQERGR